MPEHLLHATARKVSPMVNVIDIRGDITGNAEPALTKAYAQATEGGVRTVLINFSGLQYMNSLGMGIIVTMLIRARKENKHLVAFGLSEHYQKLFSLTRLDQALPIYESEEVALASAERMDLPEREY